MKSKLAIFDFDHTLKQPSDAHNKFGVANLFPDQTIPEEILQVRVEKGWDYFLAFLLNKVNDLNKSKDEITASLDDQGYTINQMDEVMKYLASTHDIIVISNAFVLHVKLFLEKQGLSDCVNKVYGRPGVIKDNGKFDISEELSGSEWGRKCSDGPCRVFCKALAMKHFIGDKEYDDIKYFGDGKNDVCPALALKKGDSVFPRIGYELNKILREDDNLAKVQAEIHPWNDGSDILKLI